MNRYSSARQKEETALAGVRKEASPHITVFRCANSSRSHNEALLAPQLQWPIDVLEVAVPCTGRLQPEHLLKAFEAGADAVCVVTCAHDGCLYLEGSRRTERRTEYVRGLLDEIGLGGERLLLFQLAASGQKQSALGHPPGDPSPGERESPAAIVEMVVAGLGALRPNPLSRNGTGV